VGPDRRIKLKWVVYAKPPFGGPQQAIEYLGSSTHSVAISNQRLLSDEDGQVSFQWKDYKHENRQNSKIMTIHAGEFIRRFLIHTLPPGFQRIRYFGFLANCHRAVRLALCRQTADRSRYRVTSAASRLPSTAESHHSRKRQPLPPLRHRHDDPGWNPLPVPVARSATP
jgi:hypothetical protein